MMMPVKPVMRNILLISTDLHKHPVQNLWFPYFTRKKTVAQKG